MKRVRHVSRIGEDHLPTSGVAGFLFGGATRPTPPSLTSVVHTFEAVAGRWGSVSAPAVSRVIGGTPERDIFF